jgi:hypothetical protein
MGMGGHPYPDGEHQQHGHDQRSFHERRAAITGKETAGAFEVSRPHVTPQLI